jgi:hypothetical protein
MLLREILWPSVLLPLLAVGAVAWLDPVTRRAPAGARMRSPWSGAAAFAGAYLAVHAATSGWPPLPAVESSDWLAWLVAAAGAGGILVHCLRLRTADPVLAALLWTGLAAVTLRPMLAHTWSRAEGAVAFGLLAFAFTVVWLAFARIEAVLRASAERAGGGRGRARHALPALVLAACFVVAGPTLALSATARLGQIAGGAGVAALGLAAVALLARGAPLPGAAAAPAATTALVGLVANGYLYAKLHPLGAVALLLAPLAALATLRATSRQGWRRTALAVAAAALVASVALGLAGWQTWTREPVETYDPWA